MFRYKFIIYLIFCSSFLSSEAAKIKGKVVLDESWAPVIYLSVIHSFDDLHTAAYGFLRYKIELDADGYFQADSLELADGDLIYRLHVCKKGDPESSIIIGGKDENFIHFIMNKNSKITLIPNELLPGLQHCKIKGQATSDSLEKLFTLQKRLDTPPDLPSEKNRAFIKKQVLSDLKTVIDTSSNDVIRLLALHFINESFTNENHLDLMEKVEKDLADSNYSSPYYDAFQDQLSFLQFQATPNSSLESSWIKWLGLGLLLPFAAFLWWKINSDQDKNKATLTVESLSKQERRVFDHLKKNKSNKEISSELHIEVSTVKSHINKIFSKLGVKSRKEIVDEER